MFFYFFQGNRLEEGGIEMQSEGKLARTNTGEET